MKRVGLKIKIEPTQMLLSHSVQIADKQNASLNPIIQFLNTINDVPQKYGSFEKAEQAIRELVVELKNIFKNQAFIFCFL